MPVRQVKQGRKFRVVESASGRIAKRNGKAIDSGGHRTKKAAVAQVNAVNLAERRRAGKSAPPRPRARRRRGR